MARVTVEDCLKNSEDVFTMVLAASNRARHLLMSGQNPTVSRENDKPTVIALREIAAGNIDHEGNVLATHSLETSNTSDTQTANVIDEAELTSDSDTITDVGVTDEVHHQENSALAADTGESKDAEDDNTEGNPRSEEEI